MRLAEARDPTHSPSPAPSVRARRWLIALVLLAEGLALGGLVHDEITWSGNESTRFATVERLVEHGTFEITGSPFETVDRARIDGRFYSDKPLLLAGWIALLYWPLHHLLGLGFAADHHLLVYLLTLVGVTTFSPLLTLLFCRRLERRGVPTPVALAAGVATVATTWILSFGTSLNNHTPAAALLFALLLQVDATLERPGPLRGALCGLWAGLLIGLEIPTGGVFTLVAGGVLLGVSAPRRVPVLAAFAVGLAVPLLIQGGLHYAAFGSPLPAYLVPGAFDFPENIHTQRAAGLHRPDAVLPYLFHLSLGQRGLFSHLPALLLGLAFLLERRRRLERTELAPALGVLVLIAFYATQTGDYGGWSYGFRFLVPVLPVLFWWAVRWSWEGRRRWRLALLAGLSAVGLATSCVGAWNPWPVVYEGSATAPGAIEQNVRSPLLANLLVRGLERNPDGAVFDYLGREVYGVDLALPYLAAAVRNLRRPELVPPLRAVARRWRAPPEQARGASGGRAAPADGNPARGPDRAPDAPAATLAIVGAVPLDPATGRAGVPSTALIADGRIVAIGPTDSVAVPAAATRVAAAGRYLLPGLWDLHTHLATLDDHAPPLLVTQGVLGVRDLGAEPEKIEALRRRVESGELLGPRIVRVGPTLNGAAHGPHHRVIDSPGAARKAVTELAAAGFDLIKTHNATGRETYFALLEAAAQAGLTVAGHVPTTVSPLEACAAGQASIDHIATLFEGTYLAGFDSELQAFLAMPGWLEGEAGRLADCFAEHGTLFVPTLRAYELRAHRAAEYDDPHPARRYMSAAERARWRESAAPTEMDRREDVIALRQSLLDTGIEFVRQLHRRGAPVGAGTDLASAGLLPGFDLHAEIRLLARAGLTPAEALRTATRGPGENAGGDPLQGRLTAGAPADLVLLGRNAFEDLSALDRVEAVVLRGELLSRADLDAVLSQLEKS